jgi:hypothetical protein
MASKVDAGVNYRSFLMSQPLPKKIREWTERIERFHRSQVSLTQFCRDEGVSVQSFYQWRKRIISNLGGKAAPNDLLANKAALDQSPSSNADAISVRITIESAGIVIHCDCDPSHLIDTVCSWGKRQRESEHQRESRFQQLVIRS